jgi:hypothetical protein
MAHPTASAPLFQLLSDLFARVGVTPVLAGGYAVNVHKFSRQTEDVDFVIPASDAMRIDEAMLRHGYSVLAKNSVFVRYFSQAPFSRIVDFLFVDGDSFSRMLSDSLPTTIGGGVFRVLSLKHLLAMKLHALKSGDRRREAKDLLDIVELARLNSVDVTSEEFRSWCRKFGPIAVFERISALAGKADA